MLITIDPHSAVPIYRQVIEQVRRQILSGILPFGEQLPSVRELAGRIKVNPMTVSKAYGQLEMLGLVERRRGIGLFVASQDGEEKERQQRELIEEVVTKAVGTARQLGVGKDEFLEIAKEVFDK